MDIGEQINKLREEKGISLEQLALGICTAASLRNMELGKEAVNKLFMEIVFQRLGKSTDKLEFIVSEELYEEEVRKEQFEEYLERGDATRAKEVLMQIMEHTPKDSNVHKMFYYRSEAYLALRAERKPESAKEWIQKALDITMPGWQERPLETYWISTIEMENLLAYAKTQLLIGTEQELEQAEQLLYDCRQFIDKRVTDKEEHAKIAAKCALLLGRLYIKQESYREAEQCALRAFQELQEYGISYFMEPLLEVLIQCRKDNFEENPYCKYLEALQHLRWHVGEDWSFADSIFKNCSQQTYYLDYELFREERIAQGYRQNQIIDGIYKNPESLSRAERGKETMRDSKLVRLFQRLGVDKSRYNGFVVTDDYAVLELKRKLDVFLSRSCYNEAEQVLEKLKSRLDSGVEENRRWIQGYEITIGTVKEEVSKEELLEQALQLLQETYRIKTNGVYRAPMDREVDLINQIGILLRQTGRKEEAVVMFQRITEAMQCSKIRLEKRYRSYCLLRTNLAKWKQSINLAEENIAFELNCGKLRCLPMNYMVTVCAMLNEPTNRERCRDMLRDVYYLWELSCNETNKNITKQYYKNVFGEEIL